MATKLLKFNFYLQFEWKPKLKHHIQKTQFVLGIMQKNEQEGKKLVTHAKFECQMQLQD